MIFSTLLKQLYQYILYNVKRGLRLANICNIIKTKYLIIFIPYVLFFYVLCLSLPDQCVCSPIAHRWRNGKFRGIGSPPGLRKFRFESLALHPSQERNCYVSTEISLHATVLSSQRQREYHRIGVTVNLFLCFMFHVIKKSFSILDTSWPSELKICTWITQIYLLLGHWSASMY